MKLTITFILTAVVSLAMAQTADSVDTDGGALDVYYNLNNQDEGSLDRSSWDIAFTTQGFDACVLVNENRGVEAYAISSDTNEWSSIDTAGYDFESNKLYNSTSNWSEGALNMAGSGHPDYGWGRYESSNHHVYGTRIFVVNTGTKWFQLQVSEMTVAGLYRIKIGDIGGANTNYYHIDKASYTEDNFVPFNIELLDVEDEPNTEEWHLLFTKYYGEIQGQKYKVSGVKINKNLEVAERMGVDVSDNDTAGLSWNENISEIGYDWKTFNRTTFSYDITPDLSYFLKNDSGDIWKLWFTKYSMGNYYFNVEKVYHNASITSFVKHNSKIYPNPAKSQVTVENNEAERSAIQLWSLDGRMISEYEVLAFGNKTLNVSNLQQGMYLIKVVSTQATTTHRLILE